MSEPTALSLAEAAAALRRGTLSSLELTRALIARIEAWNPAINAFVRFDPEPALKAARKADRARKAGRPAPLHGVPLAHKDMYYRKGTLAECGSRVRQGFRPETTAQALTRLDAAGALQIGALNMSEFAFNPTGHNPHFGHCRNPWNTDRITGGSSSGSGAAVAARLAYGALGSDTGGSIRGPSYFCGLSGIKPTYGRVSRAGAMPLSFSLDHVGPLTRTVADSALMLQAIAGPDADDPTTLGLPKPANYVASCRAPVKGFRLGVPRRYFWDDMDGEIGRALEQALAAFRSLGVKLVELDGFDLAPINAAANVILASEAAAAHRPWLASRPLDYSLLVRSRLDNGLSFTAVQYVDALRARGAWTQRFLALFDKVDALFCPGMNRPTPTIAEADMDISPDAPAIVASVTRLMRPINYLGVPALSVPAGFAHGLPTGFQLLARPFDETTLFSLGAAYQRATDWHRQAPKLPA